MRITRRIKLLWQRITKGYDESEVWTFKLTHAKWTYKRLELFKKTTMSIPMRVKDMEEWHNILDHMIDAFKFYAEEKDDIL